MYPTLNAVAGVFFLPLMSSLTFSFFEGKQRRVHCNALERIESQWQTVFGAFAKLGR